MIQTFYVLLSQNINNSFIISILVIFKFFYLPQNNQIIMSLETNSVFNKKSFYFLRISILFEALNINRKIKMSF